MFVQLNKCVVVCDSVLQRGHSRGVLFRGGMVFVVYGVGVCVNVVV